MKHLLTLASGLFMLIVSVDQQSNVTARVIDGTIFPLVDEAQTTHENGIVHVHAESAAANKTYLRRHCNLHLATTGKDPSGCGYKS